MKPHRLYQIIFGLLTISGLFWPMKPVLGQANISLALVQVLLLPEYDHPHMLVVLDVVLSPETPLPQTLTFQVPVDVESLSVIQQAETGALIPLETETNAFGKWKDLRFTTESRNITIKFDDPSLVKEGDQRSYEYQWLSIYPVNALSVTARQPFGAGEIQAEPALNEQTQGADEASHYTGEMGSIPAGELFTLNLHYTKDPANLAYPALPVEAAQPVSEETPGRTPSPLSVITWLMIVAVAVLILVGLYYWWFKSTSKEKQDQGVQGVGIMNPEKQAVFCHECGMRSRPGDSYCSNCGTELRMPIRKA